LKKYKNLKGLYRNSISKVVFAYIIFHIFKRLNKEYERTEHCLFSIHVFVFEVGRNIHMQSCRVQFWPDGPFNPTSDRGQDAKIFYDLFIRIFYLRYL
jgi:hypothetical protein